MGLRDIFPNARFSSPATEELIAEAALEVTLPNELRKLYLEGDGFREDRGNARMRSLRITITWKTSTKSSAQTSSMFGRPVTPGTMRSTSDG